MNNHKDKYKILQNHKIRTIKILMKNNHYPQLKIITMLIKPNLNNIKDKIPDNT